MSMSKFKVGLVQEQWHQDPVTHQINLAAGIEQAAKQGAELIVYSTAIGGEPTEPWFYSQPMWQKVRVAQGIMANTFIVAINRIG